MIRRAFLLIALFALLAPGGTAPAWAGEVTIVSAWARASAGRVPNGAAYVQVRNEGSATVKLVGASSPVAERTAIHSHETVDGMMRMQPVDAWPIAPGATAAMVPGGHHLMLMKLRRRLVEGEIFPLTLRFDDGTVVETEVIVAGVGARHAPDAAGQSHHH